MSFSLKRLAVIPESNSWTNDSFFCWSSLRSVRILNSFFAILRQSFVEFALLTFKASLTRTRLIDDGIGFTKSRVCERLRNAQR